MTADPLNALISAIEFRNTAAALRLIRSGMPLDGVMARTLDGKLHSSALIESGANPNIALPDGLTPLEHAARAALEQWCAR